MRLSLSRVPIDHPSIRDPDGRVVVFDAGTRLHLALGRPKLMNEVDLILGTVAHPDHRADDPLAGREHFIDATSTLDAGYGWS
jgi:hypothetical protein